MTSYIERQVRRFFKCQVVGLDLEWEPDRYRGSDNRPSLLQIYANGSYIFDLSEYKFFPPSLRTFLESDSVVKAVAGSNNDKRKLKSHFNVELKGEVDVLDKAWHMGFYRHRPSLQKLARDFLGLNLDKSHQESFRRHKPVSTSQIAYAATDAWVVHDLYYKLNNYSVSQLAG